MNNALKRWPLVTASAKDGLSCRRRQWRRNQWTVVGGGRVGDGVLVGDGGLGRSGERSIGERGSSETDILLVNGYHTRNQDSRNLCKLSHFYIPFFIYIYQGRLLAFSRPPANFKKFSWLSAWQTHVSAVLYFYRSASLVFGFRNGDYVKIKMAAQRKVFVVGVGMTKVSV